MNALIVGANKKTVLDYLSFPFLLIDDGELIDAIEIPTRKVVTHFDVSKHSFNPLKDIDYKRARELLSVLDAVFPEGENTLTHKNSNFILLNALLNNPRSIDTLLHPMPKDGAHTDAYQKLQTILLSPVLRDVLTKPTNLSFRGTILARLDRAELGGFVAFVIANFLVGQYRGQVVIPDFGFYAHDAHTELIRQNRLIAGVTTLSELPKALAQQLLLADEKKASHATADDAHTLGVYEGLIPGTEGFSTFVQQGIR